MGARRPPDRASQSPQDDAREPTPFQNGAGDGRRSADEGAKDQVEGTSQDVASRDARGYSWPPFQPGHTLSVRHGANSPRAIATRAELIRPRLFEVCPWLHETHDVIAVDRFLRAESRALILHEYIAGICDGPGAAKVPVKVWEQATAADNLAARLGNTLGLDPTGRARLQQTVVSTEVTLADLAAQGRQTSGYRALVEGDDADEPEPA